MSDFRDLLRTGSPTQTLVRASQWLGRQTRYVLGKGGVDPLKPPTRECDCSGFVAWALGIPRFLPIGGGKWLSTDEYWRGGPHGFPGLFDQRSANEATTGDLVVYPDAGGKQGHIGIITELGRDGIAKVIHCSSGNDKKFGDAVRVTSPRVWTSHSQMRIVRPDFPALRQLFGLTSTPRLIAARWTGDPANPYAYRHVADATWANSRFSAPVKSVAEAFGLASPDATVRPVREAIQQIGLVVKPNTTHLDARTILACTCSRPSQGLTTYRRLPKVGDNAAWTGSIS